MFLRITAFVFSAQLVLFASVAARPSHLMDAVRTIVGKMTFIEAPLPDASGASKVSVDGHFTYRADFDCTNGSVSVDRHDLIGGPTLSGTKDAAKLEFAIDLGAVAADYQCTLYSQYPDSPGGPEPAVSEISGQVLSGQSTPAICTIEILKAGTSCSILPSFVLTNITVHPMWGPGGALFAGYVNTTLQTAMIPVLNNATTEMDLCFLLD